MCARRQVNQVVVNLRHDFNVEKPVFDIGRIKNECRIADLFAGAPVRCPADVIGQVIVAGHAHRIQDRDDACAHAIVAVRDNAAFGV